MKCSIKIKFTCFLKNSSLIWLLENLKLPMWFIFVAGILFLLDGTALYDVHSYKWENWIEKKMNSMLQTRPPSSHFRMLSLILQAASTVDCVTMNSRHHFFLNFYVLNIFWTHTSALEQSELRCFSAVTPLSVKIFPGCF